MKSDIILFIVILLIIFFILKKHPVSSYEMFFYFTVLFFVVALWTWKWKIQLFFNNSGVSLYTPDVFPISSDKKEQYKKYISVGKEKIKNSTVVIAALLRDVSSKIPDIIKKIETIGSFFKDYVVLIVENDSADDTREQLVLWARRNARVKILGCGINSTVCKLRLPKTADGHEINRSRIEKMVRLRNIYLQEIKNNYRDWDYAFFWDTDIIGNVYIDGIEHSIGYMAHHPDVKVTCANGLYRWWGPMTFFYDTYALLPKNEMSKAHTQKDHVRKALWGMKYNRGDDPIEVDSCFSGFAIYNVNALLDEHVIYDMSPTDDNIECEHVRLNKKIRGKKIVNPSMIYMILYNE